MEFLCKSRAITLVQMCEKMSCDNPYVGLVNINAYLKYGEILSISSQDIMRKHFFS